MRNIVLLIISTILFVGCEQKIIGSDAYETVDGLEFTITSYEPTNIHLIASGTVTNTRQDTLYATWWVEAIFYTDSTHEFILGGDDVRMYYSLPPGATTNWQLIFQDNSVNASNYPNFSIGNLRAHH